MQKFVRSALVVAAAAVIPLVPTAAHADRYTYADHTGDVVSFTGGSDTATPAPERVVGDIAASAVAHRRGSVTVKMRYRDLTRGDEIAAHLFVIRTSRMTRDVTVVAAQGYYGGRVVMTKPSGKKVSCRIARKIDYVANTVTASVPRSCLGQPRWVKVGMAGILFTGLGSSDMQYVDDARTNGNLGSNPRFGPRVYR